MKIAAIVIWALAAAGARAVPLAITCHQDISQQSYTPGGAPLPAQRIEATVGYILDFDRRTLTVTSLGRTTRFTDGGSRHITVDREGMNIFGTSQLGRDGPTTSEILHFSADGAAGVGERKLLLHGRLLQKAETVLRCRPAA